MSELTIFSVAPSRAAIRFVEGAPSKSAFVVRPPPHDFPYVLRNADGEYIRSGQQLPASGEIRFDVTTIDGLSIPPGHRVEWRVANTGRTVLRRRQ